jgi:YgiT-type zinc finger domain-containing protein
MTCIHCKGKMEYKSAPFQIDRKGYHLMLDAVPAWVCTQCGESYFEESEVNTIQGLLESMDEGTEKLALAG